MKMYIIILYFFKVIYAKRKLKIIKIYCTNRLPARNVVGKLHVI